MPKDSPLGKILDWSCAVCVSVVVSETQHSCRASEESRPAVPSSREGNCRGRTKRNTSMFYMLRCFCICYDVFVLLIVVSIVAIVTHILVKCICSRVGEKAHKRQTTISIETLLLLL